jgi:hypothetical protein
LRHVGGRSLTNHEPAQRTRERLIAGLVARCVEKRRVADKAGLVDRELQRRTVCTRPCSRLLAECGDDPILGVAQENVVVDDLTPFGSIRSYDRDGKYGEGALGALLQGYDKIAVQSVEF